MVEQQLCAETLQRLLALAGQRKATEIQLLAFAMFRESDGDRGKAAALLYDRIYGEDDSNQFTNEAVRVFCSLAVEAAALLAAEAVAAEEP
jgi:hypothetical protein